MLSEIELMNKIKKKTEKRKNRVTYITLALFLVIIPIIIWSLAYIQNEEFRLRMATQVMDGNITVAELSTIVKALPGILKNIQRLSLLLFTQVFVAICLLSQIVILLRGSDKERLILLLLNRIEKLEKTIKS